MREARAPGLDCSARLARSSQRPPSHINHDRRPHRTDARPRVSLSLAYHPGTSQRISHVLLKKTCVPCARIYVSAGIDAVHANLQSYTTWIADLFYFILFYLNKLCLFTGSNWKGIQANLTSFIGRILGSVVVCLGMCIIQFSGSASSQRKLPSAKIIRRLHDNISLRKIRLTFSGFILFEFVCCVCLFVKAVTSTARTLIILNVTYKNQIN